MKTETTIIALGNADQLVMGGGCMGCEGIWINSPKEGN